MKRRKPSRLSKGETVCTGVAWFEPEQWRRLKQIAEDREELDETYEHWLRGIRQLERDFTRQGIEVHRIAIDADQLREWCLARQRPLDSSARADYVVEALRAKFPSPPK